jgi:hypothetical protein
MSSNVARARMGLPRALRKLINLWLSTNLNQSVGVDGFFRLSREGVCVSGLGLRVKFGGLANDCGRRAIRCSARSWSCTERSNSETPESSVAKTKRMGLRDSVLPKSNRRSSRNPGERYSHIRFGPGKSKQPYLYLLYRKSNLNVRNDKTFVKNLSYTEISMCRNER